MTNLEEKNLKTQLHLLREIKDHEYMISYCIGTEGGSILNSIKPIVSEDGKKVELSVEDFLKVERFLKDIRDSNKTNMSKFAHGLAGDHIDQKEIKTKILGMLS